MAYFVVYNNMSNLDLEIEVVKRPLIPMPVRRYKTITIKGHDGNYYSDEETYEDMTFPIQFNFLEEDLDNIRRKVRRIRAWIENASDNKLILSDNNGYYYKVCKAEIGEINYENIYEIQSFLINFTVEPYQYILNNEEFILTKEIYNNWDICKPLYRIKGNGACTFTINGININCNVNQELIIDTENDKILNSDKTLAEGLTDIKKMQNLYLKGEENVFNWTNGFTIYITPNWRTI